MLVIENQVNLKQLDNTTHSKNADSIQNEGNLRSSRWNSGSFKYQRYYQVFWALSPSKSGHGRTGIEV